MALSIISSTPGEEYVSPHWVHTSAGNFKDDDLIVPVVDMANPLLDDLTLANMADF